MHPRAAVGICAWVVQQFAKDLCVQCIDLIIQAS